MKLSDGSCSELAMVHFWAVYGSGGVQSRSVLLGLFEKMAFEFT